MEVTTPPFEKSPAPALPSGRDYADKRRKQIICKNINENQRYQREKYATE
jgi:hypothetical protein